MSGQSTLTRLVSLATVTFVAMIALSLPQLADPLIRWDDYPAYFGNEQAFNEKTLTEGRWLNYWWIARPFLWSAQVNFLVYHAGWAIFAAGAALTFLGPQTRFVRLFLLSVMIALSPQAFLISAWFNTLIAAVWFLALYATLSVLVSARTGLFLFAVLAPISMLLYSTFPFVMICLCALRHDARQSIVRFAGLVLLLGAGIVLGMLLMYSLNYAAYGIFDVVLADDRTFLPPATSFDTALSNARYVAPLLAQWLFQTLAFGVTWLGVLVVGLFAIAFVILLRAEPLRGIYALGLIAVFIGVVLAHAILEGIMIPMRSLIAVWIVICATLFQSVRHLPEHVLPRHIDLVCFLVIAVVAGQFVRNTAFLLPWQAETRRIAESIPKDTKRIYLWGDYQMVDGAKRAHILHNDALTKRLEMLTGAEVVSCTSAAACGAEQPSLQGSEEDHLVLTRELESFVVLIDKSGTAGR